VPTSPDYPRYIPGDTTKNLGTLELRPAPKTEPLEDKQEFRNRTVFWGPEPDFLPIKVVFENKGDNPVADLKDIVFAPRYNRELMRAQIEKVLMEADIEYELSPLYRADLPK
jgi:hypothetical protein